MKENGRGMERKREENLERMSEYSVIQSAIRPHGNPHELPDLANSSTLRATGMLQYRYSTPGLRNSAFDANFFSDSVNELSRASFVPVTRKEPI